MAELGRWLKRLRTVRGISVDLLAERTGVNRATLYRWERGDAKPRATELLTVLNKLQASQTERQEALSLIDAPRALCAQRSDELALASCETHLPAFGDLLRAIRIRHDMKAHDLARLIRVNPSLVTRWEKSLNMPTADTLKALTNVLQLLPAERDYLSAPSLHLGVPLAEVIRTEDAGEAHLARILEASDQEADFAGDLHYLALEAHLVRAGMSRLLVRTWVHHAQYLLWRGRRTEMDRYLRMIIEHGYPRQYRLTVVGMQAHYLAHGRGKSEFRRTAEYLLGNKELADLDPDGATLYRDTGEYLTLAGMPEEAVRLIRLSRHVADRREDALGHRFSYVIEARALVGMGRHEMALALIPQDEAVAPQFRLYEVLELARASFFLGAHSDAVYWLERFDALIDRSGLENMRPHGDFLKEQL